MTDHTSYSANEDLSVLLELAPRAADLATRLVAAGPKAAHVSASETHEIAEFIHAAIAALRGSAARASAADGNFIALFPNDVLCSAQFHELWERAGKDLSSNYSAQENLPRQVGKFAAFVAREARGDGMAPERIIQAIRAAGYRDHPTDIARGCVNAIVNEVTPLLKPKQYPALARELASSVPAEPGVSTRQYHILKTDPDQFQAVVSGAKTFEIRLNDRGYAVGDVLGLRETRHTAADMRAGAPLVYTGRECQRFISHVLTGYGLAEGWCCLSFELPDAGGGSSPVPNDGRKSDEIYAASSQVALDPLQGAANWLVQTHCPALSPTDLAGRLTIGHNRAKRLYDAALAAQPGPQKKECGCATCRPHSDEMRMILCSDCGDKRCPHGADHRNACTGEPAKQQGTGDGNQ